MSLHRERHSWLMSAMRRSASSVAGDLLLLLDMNDADGVAT
jgi:hypothetical protein